MTENMGTSACDSGKYQNDSVSQIFDNLIYCTYL